MIENILKVAAEEVVGGWSRWVMGIKEGDCFDDQWLLYVSGTTERTAKSRATFS